MANNNARIKEKSLSLYQQDHFNRDNWFAVAAADYETLIEEYDFQILLNSDKELSLLDLGCGTGKFPSMLAPLLDKNSTIKTSLLDPSEFSLQQCSENLTKPFYAADQYQCFFEDLETKLSSDVHFDVMWSIQSLYCADQSRIEKTLETFLKHLRKDGKLLIYLASTQSSYIQIQNLYLENFENDGTAPYLNAEKLQKHLSALDCKTSIHQMKFDHVIPQFRKRLLLNFLNQCALADMSLDDWMGNRAAQDWLAQFKCGEDYRIPQNVWFFEIKHV